MIYHTGFLFYALTPTPVFSPHRHFSRLIIKHFVVYL